MYGTKYGLLYERTMVNSSMYVQYTQTDIEYHLPYIPYFTEFRTVIQVQVII
jgi:hypothetical protein